MFLYLIYKSIFWRFRFFVFFVGFSFFYSKGLFLSATTNHVSSVSFHVHFILTILPLFFIFLGRGLYQVSFFYFIFFCFFLTCFLYNVGFFWYVLYFFFVFFFVFFFIFFFDF